MPPTPTSMLLFFGNLAPKNIKHKQTKTMKKHTTLAIINQKTPIPKYQHVSLHDPGDYPKSAWRRLKTPSREAVPFSFSVTRTGNSIKQSIKRSISDRHTTETTLAHPLIWSMCFVIGVTLSYTGFQPFVLRMWQTIDNNSKSSCI